MWQNILGELEISISKANFTTWFRNTFIMDYKKGVFTIGVPTFFVKDWLEKKYYKEINTALQNQVSDRNVSVKYKITAPSPEQVVSLNNRKVIHRPVDKFRAKKQPVFSAQSLPKNNTLNDLYQFDNFIVGSSNQLAHAAAEAVVKKTGTAYNPLFIYGDSGLGKTHLMQAIGNLLIKNNDQLKVIYTTSETFMNEFISAVEFGAGKAKDFKKHYRNVDVLLIDDIQFFGGKESTQEEFFHTFNHLHQNKKQVVLTADRIPKAIDGLEKRLQTRFEGGMVADIGLPDLETRAAILRQKAKAGGDEIDDKVINFIAENIKTSIRELEGALTKILATCKLKKCQPDLEISSEILSQMIQSQREVITPSLIIKEVCSYFKIPIEDVLSSKRSKEIVRPRQIIMYILREEINFSYPIIGREMGGRDHTTVIHGHKKIVKEITNDIRLKNDISFIKERIQIAVKS